jgi:alkyldihydroxyacetonephosphate synthase
MRTALRHGAAISHHHGIGLVRLGYLEEALGTGLPLLSGSSRASNPTG